MPWINPRVPSARIIECRSKLAMEEAITEALEDNPSLEVHVTCTNMGYAATLIDRGSINYRPPRD